MEDNKYKKGQIYKIISISREGKCYVGSTCEGLSQRLARHKYMYNQVKNRGKEKQRSANKLFDEYGVENCIIEWIEDYPCKSKKELEAREGYHIKLNDCFNKRIEGRTDKEYRDDNVEREKERHKIYYENNKDKRKEYNEKNKEHYKQVRKKWSEDNKDTIKEKKKEYREKNKEYIKQRDREYYQANKERLNQKYNCGCGGCYSHQHRSSHFRTKIHQDWLKQQEQE